jgi:hypothetical protein
MRLATFRLPVGGETFSEVEFPELSKEEAEELVKKYNTEGAEAGYGQRNLSIRGGPYRGGRGPRPPRKHLTILYKTQVIFVVFMYVCVTNSSCQ